MTRIKSIGFPNSETEMSTLFDKLQRSTTSELLTTGALAIHGSASALAKTVNTIYFMVDGQMYSKTAADCAALVGTVANATFNVFVFSVNAAGTFATQMGTGAATLGGVVFPAVADGYVAVGFVIVNPTGTGAFTGGTIALDDATVVPNAVYINTLGDFFPQYSTL
jgi:glycine cleavage system protein P-like pyridoxal-binding family